MLAEWLTPRVEVALGGERWAVVFTHQVLLEIEQLTGCSAMAGEINLWTPSARLLRAAVYTTARRAGVGLSMEQAGRMVATAAGLGAAAQLRAAWIASMPEPETEGPSKEKRRRATSWPQVWADNREHLRLGSAEWLEMTPRMVQELSRSRLEAGRQREWLLSRIGAHIVNFGFCRPNPPLPDDVFMSNPWKKRGGQAQTGDDVLRMLAGVGWIDSEGKKAIREVLDSES